MKSSYNKYVLKIELIEKKVIDLTSACDLFDIKEFNVLRKEAENNLSITYKFVEQPNISEQQKLIAIYSLREVNFENYFRFFEKAIQLYKDSIISEYVLYTILNPGYVWNCCIPKNYKKQKVQDAISENMTSVYDFLKEMFKLTIDGQLWLGLEDERLLDKKHAYENGFYMPKYPD